MTGFQIISDWTELKLILRIWGVVYYFPYNEFWKLILVFWKDQFLKRPVFCVLRTRIRLTCVPMTLAKLRFWTFGLATVLEVIDHDLDGERRKIENKHWSTIYYSQFFIVGLVVLELPRAASGMLPHPRRVEWWMATHHQVGTHDSDFRFPRNRVSGVGSFALFSPAFLICFLAAADAACLLDGEGPRRLPIEDLLTLLG